MSDLERQLLVHLAEIIAADILRGREDTEGASREAS